MESFAFGGEEADRVEVQVHGYEREPVGEYHDDNWVRATVIVNVGSFSGSFDATFLTSELAEFRESVMALYESLVGIARFTTLEDQLALELAGNGRGQIDLKGLAVDAPGIGNRLQFHLSLDQGHLFAALKGLDGIASSFPVRAV